VTTLSKQADSKPLLNYLTGPVKTASTSLLLLASLSVHITQAEELHVAVAANFYSTANLIKQQFEKENNDTLIIIRGSTGKLYAQIKHGAPYDIFLAADSKRPALLEQENLILHNSRKTYAIGQLALWSKNNNKPLEQLKQNNFNKLAIANPKIAPYGQASIDTLKYLGLYNQVIKKLVYGENISQAYQFVQSGSADLGLVALSQIKNSNYVYWLPPGNSHQALEQQLVILKSSKHPELARRLSQFILSQDIQELVRQQGYETL